MVISLNSSLIFADSAGFLEQVIPYFALEGLPQELKKVSLNYLSQAVQKIKDIPEFKRLNFYIQGASKGAEASTVWWEEVQSFLK